MQGMIRTAWLISTLIFLLVAGGVWAWMGSQPSVENSDPTVDVRVEPDESDVSEETVVTENSTCPAAPVGPEGESVQGPWNGSLEWAVLSQDGATIESKEAWMEGGGVPSMIVDAEGRWIAAFQWFPCDEIESFDRVAIRISEDQGVTWSDPELATFEGLPEEYQRPFDPTLVVTPEGKIRMYFTSSETGASTFDSTIQIYSAISEDGIQYTFEEGVRFEMEEDPAYDSAVAYWDDTYVLITPHNQDGPQGKANFALSTDGLNFTTQPLIELDEPTNWTGNFVVINGALRFYGTDTGSGLWWTETTDGSTWSKPVFLNEKGGDPAVACDEEGTCRMVTVGAFESMSAPVQQPPAQKD